MKLVSLLLVLSFLLGGFTLPAAASPWQAKVDGWVLETAAQGETEFLVLLSQQADLSAAVALPTKQARGLYVYQSLTELAQRTQPPVMGELERLGAEYRSFWVANMLWVRGGMEVVQSMASRSDVQHIYANPPVRLEAPAAEQPAPSEPLGVEWNIALVGAPQVWALGYTGQGTVIGGADTGYAWNHPAIINQYRGWDGSAADHDYNWRDATASPSPTPVDPYGHGTHTMGTMVGDDGGSNQVGMAPGARWIGCRNMDAGGVGSPATYSDCYQWFIAPTRIDGSQPRPDLAPDVINNSWGCPPSEGCTDPNVLLLVVQSVRAAGIVTVHSAGNSGSGCSTVNTPSAIYAESFTVGATTSSDVLANYSSRGPVTVDGSGRLKPDISAPGSNVRSSIPGGGYAAFSGTSMAGPHVAGLVGLLLSAAPGLSGQVDLIEDVIEQNARHISSNSCSSTGVPNNLYGWGRIQALEAVNAVLAHHLELEKAVSDATVSPGQVITYTLSISHTALFSPTTHVLLTDSLPAGTTFVSASQPYTLTNQVVTWSFPVMQPGEARLVELSVQVDYWTGGQVVNADYAVSSNEVLPVVGAPVVSQVIRLHYIPFTLK